MTWKKNGFLALIALSFLSACMGGGDGDGAKASSNGTSIVVLSAPPAPPQVNGLAYGIAGQSLSDAEGVEISALQSAGSDSAAANTDTVAITFDAGFFAVASTARNAEAIFLGETVMISGGEGTLTNGQTVRLFYDPSAAGSYVGAAQLAAYAALETTPPANPINAEAHYLFGFLSDPDVINARISGAVRYSGDIVATGFVTTNGVASADLTGTELDGAINLTVNFDDDWVTGDLSATYTADTQIVPIDLSLPHTAFSGNTFAGAFECATTGGCASATEMNAGFFGPSADEVGGVLQIETVHDIGEDRYQFSGAGSFVITSE